MSINIDPNVIHSLWLSMLKWESNHSFPQGDGYLQWEENALQRYTSVGAQGAWRWSTQRKIKKKRDPGFSNKSLVLNRTAFFSFIWLPVVSGFQVFTLLSRNPAAIKKNNNKKTHQNNVRTWGRVIFRFHFVVFFLLILNRGTVFTQIKFV